MKFSKLCCPILAILQAVGCASTTRQPAGTQTPRMLQREIRKTVTGQYLLYLPENYGQEKERWPLVMFLHGAGERGDDIELLKVHGPPKIVAQGEHFPFILVSPQCPKYEGWSIDYLNALLDEVSGQYRVDKDRIYVTGLSMGGYGAWLLAETFPDRFAAIAPICGGGNPARVHRLKDLPIWVFHGARDETVPLERSQVMVDSLKAAGSQVKFTIYPEAGHVEAWENAYSDPAFYQWLLDQRR